MCVCNKSLLFLSTLCEANATQLKQIEGKRRQTKQINYSTTTALQQNPHATTNTLMDLSGIVMNIFVYISVLLTPIQQIIRQLLHLYFFLYKT